MTSPHPIWEVLLSIMHIVNGVSLCFVPRRLCRVACATLITHIAPVPFLPLAIPRAVVHPPEGPAWLFEPKLDGWRVQVAITSTGVRLYTRHGNFISHKLPRHSGRRSCRPHRLPARRMAWPASTLVRRIDDHHLDPGRQSDRVLGVALMGHPVPEHLGQHL